MKTITPAEFVLSCTERGYHLQIGKDGVCFAAHCHPPKKVQSYLESYREEIAAFISRGKAAPSMPAVNPANDEFDVFDAGIKKESEPFTLPKVVHRPFCDSVLAIMDADQWTQLFAIFRYSLDSHHVIDLAKHLHLSQDTLQSALDELVKRGVIRRTEGYPGSVCLHVPFVGSHGVEVPAVFYRGWPGNLDLSQLTEEAPDAPDAAASRSTLNINVPASDTGHNTQQELF